MRCHLLVRVVRMCDTNLLQYQVNVHVWGCVLEEEGDVRL